MIGEVFLIPIALHEEENALNAIPQYIIDAVQKCDCFFVENEKTARRFLKKIWKTMIIDNYHWQAIQKVEISTIASFTQLLKAGKNIGILSEAGCPGVADPGQLLVAEAQKLQAKIHPLVGPNAILLALMASGMNGQHFEFIGYLPIDTQQRRKKLKEIEENSLKKNCTYIFIETPYRNNALIKDIITSCHPATQFCIAVDITSTQEYIRTKTINEWRKNLVDIHKRPAIFLLYKS